MPNSVAHEGERSRHPHAWGTDLAATVALLGALNLSTTLGLNEWVQAAVQVAGALLAVMAAARRGYTWSELGLAPADVPAGLRLGGLTSLGLVPAVALVALLPPLRAAAFEDERFTDMSAAEVFVELGIRIPLVTALSEELLFRSVLLAVLLVAVPTWRAVGGSSLLFGVWHVLITISDLGRNELTDGFDGWRAVGAVVVVVLFTTAGGMVLCFLRLRSRSIVAPWLVHSTLNSAMFAAGTIVAN